MIEVIAVIDIDLVGAAAQKLLLVHDLIEEDVRLLIVQIVQHAMHQGIDGRRLPMEQEIELRNDVVLGPQELVLRVVGDRLRLLSHPPVFQGLFQGGLVDPTQTAEQRQGKGRVKQLIGGDQSVGAPDRAAKTLLQKPVPLVPVQHHIGRLCHRGSAVLRPPLCQREQGPVDQLRQSDARMLPPPKRPVDDLLFLFLREAPRSGKGLNGGFQDQLATVGLLRHRIVSVVPFLELFAAPGAAPQLDHASPVEPALHAVLGRVRQDGQAVASLRQEQTDGRVRGPDLLQGLERSPPLKGVVDAQQQGAPLRDRVLQNLNKGLRLGFGQDLAGGKAPPYRQAAAPCPQDGGAKHEAALALAAVSGDDDGRGVLQQFP